jgi:hypothetical protein
MDKKAQASTEYLVILAVVVIIAVVVVSLLIDLSSLGGETADRSSKLYWKTAEIGLLDWAMRSIGDDELVIKNNQEYDIRLVNVTINGNTLNFTETPVTLNALQTRTISGEWVSCEADSSYGYTVSFVYDNTEFNLKGKTFTGAQKIVGTCQ